MLSRALLIARVAFFFFQRFSSAPRGQPGSIVGDASHSAAFRMVRSSGPLRTLPAVYVSAVIDGGSHPFPFRTRKLSLLSPMVLGLRARESRSLQDSRPTCCKQRVGLFLCPLHFVTLSRPQPVDTGCLSLTAPCPQGGGALRFYRPFRLAASLPPKGGHVHIGAEAPSGQRSPPRQVDTCRLRLTPLAVNSEWGFFYARVVMPAKAGTSLPDPSP